MKKLAGLTFAVLISALLLPCYGSVTACASLAAPSDRHISYTGRIDFSTPDRPVLFWSNSSIRARFTGTSIKVILDDSSGQDTFCAVIDGDESKAITIQCKKGIHIYDAASQLDGDDHEILLVKRTEYDAGSTGFCGFILDEGRELSKFPLYVPQRRIEFYGDSITCGMGNEDLSRKNNSDMSLENGYMTYAAMTARNLSAQTHIISKSGIGFMVSWGDVIMPDIYDRLNPNDPKSKWDFSRWTPDVVVVNLGTNDNWLCGSRFKTAPSQIQIVEAYIGFIQALRARYSEAYILCALGNMNSTEQSSQMPGYIEQAVSIMKERYGETKLDTIFFPYKQTDAHPTISEQKAMVGPLTAKISRITGWDVKAADNEKEGN